ncbi:YcaO-like family protein [Lentzea aerocolonigenes]|uniref:YcaO-like family protein n=1 Tax=Lentzea aerocolonigenes TaxID=68170 RepID=UPI0005EC9566|nr:YcaO-like family protein [Lentzea aerocolonigenes]
MLREHAAKIAGNGTHRERTAEDTWRAVSPHLRTIGVTRVADITGLDRIGIPVYSAIAPRSNDVISVYNGKGTTAVAARTSAVMEAVERYAAALPARPVAVAPYAELAGTPVLDPRECLLQPHPRWTESTPISWVEGHDLLSGSTVLVPAFIAGYHVAWHETPCSAVATTNGIASGNTVEEAVCHALSELIERDDWTMAELVAHYLSAQLDPADALPLRQRYPDIELDSLPDSAARLVEMFELAGVSLRLKNITGVSGVPSVFAVSVEDLAPTFSYGHHGIGTHPDAEVAVLRAITEVAQCRAVDMQALREDITLPGSDVHKSQWHAQRASKTDEGSWATAPTAAIRFRDLPSRPSDDVVADIRVLLDVVLARGLDKAIVVDLSPPGIPASVVRVIVPGLESWSIDSSRIGARATHAWNEAVRSLELERA